MVELPKIPEAEETIIGTILLNSDQNETFAILPDLSEDDFYVSANKLIYGAIKKLNALNIPIVPSTITKFLIDLGTDRDTFEDTLFNCCDRAVPMPGLNHWVTVVKDLAQRRKLMVTCQKAICALPDIGSKIETTINDITGACLETVNRTAQSQIDSASTCATACLDAIVMRQDNKNSSGLGTGFPSFDKVFGGLVPGEYIISAGRPGMGKTALALDMAMDVSKDHDVYIFSLEMTKQELIERLISKKTRIPQQVLRSGYMNKDQLSAVMKASGEICELKLYIDDDPTLTPGQIYAKVLGHSARHHTKPALVVVDYIGLVTPDAPGGSREQEVATMSRSFKQQAKLLNCTYLVVCQLNREAERREDREPRLSDLRESGAIEQDANVVLMLYRKGYYTKRTEDVNNALCVVAKNRSGACPKIKLFWEPETASFKTLTQRTEDVVANTRAVADRQLEDLHQTGHDYFSNGNRLSPHHGPNSKGREPSSLFD